MAPFTREALPQNYREAFDELSPAAQQAWMEQRLRGQLDHLFLANELMGYDFQPNPHRALFREYPQMDPEQKKGLHELGYELVDGRLIRFNKRMILWSRGTFKTSSVIVEIVQLILNFPNIRILFLSGSKKLSKRQLARVKKVFEKPKDKFRQLYPEFCAAPGKKLPNSDSEEFTVPCRTLDQIAEPTLCISSAKSVKAGSHFDVIFVDDLVNDQNWKSATLLEACWEDYKAIGPLLEPAGFMFVTGTRYVFGDPYELIQEAAQREMREKKTTVWKFSIKTCWIKFCKTCGHPDSLHNSDLNYTRPPCTHEGCECKCFVDSGQKQVLFPIAVTNDGRQVGHTVEFLESEKNEKGEEFFACQYENNPIAAGTKVFTPELIAQQTFFHLNVIPPQAPTLMIGDLSYIGQEHRDQTVQYLCKLWMGEIWVFDALCGKWDSDQWATHTLAAFLQHRPQVMWFEAFLGWDAYNNVILSKAAALGITNLPIVWLPMSNKKDAKLVRIGGAAGWLKNKKLWLFAGLPNYQRLVDQLGKWPKLPRHKDDADALGMVCEAPHGAGAIPSVSTEQYSTINHIRQMHAERAQRAEMERFGGGGTGSGLVSG